jgi:hypothetical protein
MSSWWICPWDNEVTIDDAPMFGIDCSEIPKNVYLIWWYPHSSQGEILYKDRLGVREPFTDLRPYLDFFNHWIVVAQKAKRPITLEQAKFVKLQMVDAVTADGRMHKNRIAVLTTVDEVANYEIKDE